MNLKNWLGINRLFPTLGAVAFLTACGSNPTVDMTPDQLAQHLGYSTASPVAEISSEARFSLKEVNSKAVIFDYFGGQEFLITLEHICLGGRSGGSLKTTSTNRMLDSDDSIIFNGEEYCRIDEIYLLQGNSEAATQ